MSLTKDDLQQIKNIVSETIDESIEKKVPQMIEDAIEKKVPQMVEDGASLVFVQGFENHVIPYVDSKFCELKGEMNDRFAAVDEKFEKIDETFKMFNKKLDTHVLSLHERIDDSIKLNGRYYDECATKKDHKSLSKRVSRLELVS
jgi:hypothetical protein